MKAFTKEEIRDLVIAVLALSLIFSYPNLEQQFIIALITVFVSFVLHEMAHKFLAIRLGATATFRMWPIGILIGLMSMFFPIRFFAPGFVEIVPYKFGRLGIKVIKLTPRDLGQIALAGVLINIVFAWVFALVGSGVFVTLAKINALLAVFNLLPFPPLDGSKVFLWSFWIWGFFMALAAIAFVIA